MGASHLSTPSPGISNLCLKQRTEQEQLQPGNRQGVEQQPQTE